MIIKMLSISLERQILAIVHYGMFGVRQGDAGAKQQLLL